jgi:hypothetical protein
MTRHEALSAVEHALFLLDKELDQQHDPMLSMIPREQMIVFRSNLRNMRQHIQSDTVPPPDQRAVGLADAVFDDWPFTPLSEAIVAADRAWMQLP